MLRISFVKRKVGEPAARGGIQYTQLAPVTPSRKLWSCLLRLTCLLMAFSLAPHPASVC